MEDHRLDPKTIDYKDKQAMLRQVAYQMQANEKGLAGNLISADDLERILSNYLKTIEVSEARTVARLMINQLRTRNFILCFMGADYYAFVHRTFLEYFCAWEFVWQFEKERKFSLDYLKIEVFGKHWQDESWHEVLRLIAGMIEPKFAGEIIDYLIDQNGEKEKFINLFLAAKCLSEVRNRQVLAVSANKLLNSLKDLLNYNYGYEASGKDFEPIREIRVQAVAAIATTWKDDPETFSWLKMQASYGENWDVQRAAVQELARGWKDEPETLLWLKNCAWCTGNPAMVFAAVQELARGWKDDPDILPVLQTHAFCHYDWSVRRAAMQELARGWKNEPGMLEFLCDRAINDPFKRQVDWQTNPRLAILEAIIEHYHDYPQTILLLRDRADNDPDEKVREFAKNQLREWGV